VSRRIARKKTLFTVPPSPDEAPALLGGRCSCGHVFFPPQRMGCDVCGAAGDAIEIVELAAGGVLKSFAMTHRRTRPGGGSPLVVGVVALDGGPVIEVVIDADDESVLSVGQRVSGRLVDVGEDGAGQTVVDCFFAPVEAA
jgi:uncharacterized OB-fold protein